MGIEKTFRDSKEIISVKDLAEKYDMVFDTVIITFQSKVLSGLLEQKLIEVVQDVSFGSSHDKYPVYRVISSPKVMFFLCPIGAPITVGVLEEIIYTLCVKRIIMYGSCGVMDRNITEGKVIVPTKAYRDEGTSYHYQVASDFIDIVNANKVMKILDEVNVDYVSGYTWTTDGFYRETEAIYEERKNQGCIVVEMEVSAVQAFANLRRIDFYSFLYGADNLDASKWDRRILGKLSTDERIKYFLLALEISNSLT